MTAEHSSRRARRRLTPWMLGGALLLVILSGRALWPTSEPDDAAQRPPSHDSMTAPDEEARDLPAGFVEQPTVAESDEVEPATSAGSEWPLSPVVGVVYTGRLIDSHGQPLGGAHIWLVPD